MLSNKFGAIYSIKMGNVNAIVLSDVQVIRESLKKEELTARAPLYITHGIMGGYGLICAEGLLWKNQRRQIIDWLKYLGMNRNSLNRESLLKKVETGAKEFIHLTERDLKQEFQINPLQNLHHTIGNIINDIVFGMKYEELDNTWIYLQHLQEEGVKLIGVSGVANFLPFLRFLPSIKKTLKFLLEGKEKTHRIYDKIIEIKKKELFNDSDSISCILKCWLKDRESSIKQGTGYSKLRSYEQLRHLLADLFGAGVDTTLTTLRWFLLYIAKYKNIQEEIYQKLNEISDLNYDVIENIAILKAAISETQRIRSVVPLGIPHGTNKTTHIGQYEIPKNSMIIPLQWAVHMNPLYWDDPESFNPNRFLLEDGSYKSPPQFIPFQSGKRMCPGEELARIILITYTAHLLKTFKISLPDDQILDFDGICGITLIPQMYKLLFKERE
ncbi:CYP306A1 family protein [Megaselia abdita]